LQVVRSFQILDFWGNYSKKWFEIYEFEISKFEIYKKNSSRLIAKFTLKSEAKFKTDCGGCLCEISGAQWCVTAGVP